MKVSRARAFQMLAPCLLILFILLTPRFLVSPPWPREERKQDEVHHVFFLKVHKAASTTVMNMIFRFALDRKLHVMLPKAGNFLSETINRNWTSVAIDLPKGQAHFDILCNHVVFDERSARGALYPDTKFLAIVRHPFAQFLSAFQFFRPGWKYLRMIPGPNPIASYFRDPDQYEPPNPLDSFTNSRMSVDFGMDPSRLEDRDYVRRYVDYLGEVFDLVLVMELFDESMIAMKRVLRWRLQDVIYIPINTRVPNSLFRNFTRHDRLVHRRKRFPDYELYEFFLERFRTKLKSFDQTFSEEVRVFRKIRGQVEQYCLNGTSPWLDIQATAWNELFRIDHTTCYFLVANEPEFVDYVKNEQVKRIR